MQEEEEEEEEEEEGSVNIKYSHTFYNIVNVALCMPTYSTPEDQLQI